MQKKNITITERPPVVAIMGHVDHGKSTLLDYIRKTNVVGAEIGGITQRLGAYEVVHRGADGKEHKITFLDTPGHAAFAAIRARGARVADIAVLVVSAEDGVKPQTLEALKTIQAAKIPFIVAINKIDKEGADIERTKQNLAENEVFVEGYGGDISFVPISAKTGEGISDLLDIVILTAEVAELSGSADVSAEGVVIEANLDKKRGLAATILIKNGTLKSGTFVVAGESISPVRIFENSLGKAIKEATFSSPVRLIGWNELPLVGSAIAVFATKKEAENYIAEQKEKRPTAPNTQNKNDASADSEQYIMPLILRASEAGGKEALEHEVAKIKSDKLVLKVVSSGVGDITENDIKLATARPHSVVLGFNVAMDTSAKAIAEKTSAEVRIFDIIYKLSEWLETAVKDRTPKVMTEEATGTAKVLKIFSSTRDKQVLGGRMEKGEIVLGAELKIMRRDFEIGRGKLRELQQQKSKAASVPEGKEFGALVESKVDIAPGDRLEAFTVVEK